MFPSRRGGFLFSPSAAFAVAPKRDFSKIYECLELKAVLGLLPVTDTLLVCRSKQYTNRTLLYPLRYLQK